MHRFKSVYNKRHYYLPFPGVLHILKSDISKYSFNMIVEIVEIHIYVFID